MKTQETDNLHVPFHARSVDGCASAIVLSVLVGSVIEEIDGHLCVAKVSCPMKSGVELIVSLVLVDAS